jgi:AcrR family transcriptional regulator
MNREEITRIYRGRLKIISFCHFFVLTFDTMSDIIISTECRRCDMNKKQDILQAAFKVFSEKGYHQTTMKDISLFLDIKRTTLYDYYKSKEEIVFELIEHMFIENPIEKTKGTTFNRLMLLCKQVLTRTSKFIKLYQILFSALPALDLETQKKISIWQIPFHEELNRILEDSILNHERKTEISFLYTSLISATMSNYISNENCIDLEKDQKRIQNIIERNL